MKITIQLFRHPGVWKADNMVQKAYIRHGLVSDLDN